MPIIKTQDIFDTPETGKRLSESDIEESIPHRSWTQTGIEAITNAPSNAIKTGQEMAQILIHPVESATAMGSIAAGGIEKLIPGEQKDEKNFNLLLDMEKKRYGGIENLKNTIATDPWGFFGDLASVLTGVGWLFRGAGALAKIKEMSEIAEKISKVGTNMDPGSIAMKGISAPLKLIPEKFPAKLYQSSAKFSGKDLTAQERAKLTQNALKYDTLPTLKGLDKTRAIIDNIKENIASKIDTAQTGKKIPIDRLFQDFGDLQKQMLAESGRPIQSAKTIARIEKEIRKANKILQRTELTPLEAQKLKQGIYKELESYYASIKESPAAVKAQKAVARAAKESLEGIIPELKQLNAEEGDLIKLYKAIEQSSYRIQKRDLMGIGLPIKVGAGGVAYGIHGALGALALGVLDTPAVKARLAIIINNLRTKGIKIRPSSAAARLGLFQIKQMKQSQEE